jgi:hypothetical protein
MTRRIIFDANDLLKLLTHYTEGKVPIESTLKELVVHPVLQRYVGFWVESNAWPQLSESSKPNEASRGAVAPLFVRYEGKKVMSWGNPKESPVWSEAPDAPKRQ